MMILLKLLGAGVVFQGYALVAPSGRVILPLTVDEYQIAQLYAVAKASKEQTGGGDGVEVLQNCPFDDKVFPPKSPLLDGFKTGQYTHKIYHMASKLPSFVSALLPTSLMTFNEIAWNAYPYCRTVLTNDFFEQKLEIKIESLHSADITLENAHNLPSDLLAKRKIIYVDISTSAAAGDTNPGEDPTEYVSKKTKRGPLPKGRWWEKKHNCPVMCAYKLVTCEFKVWGFQGRVEDMIQRQEERVFTILHRQLFCWTDEWYGMTMRDIRKLEDVTKGELETQRRSSQLRGLKINES
ncbi:phosphatidylinositol transfer protein [Echinococcus multilocularis]|uniref:Phosphatidylinositol transfer protein n=1 Tax=Echinococcus multilocularis TaxID=6211 RepID=A0A068Y4Q8_ECHMU|nr:phosphatidylinositol transfer protein [Echinococcus multilocularis]